MNSLCIVSTYANSKILIIGSIVCPFYLSHTHTWWCFACMPISLVLKKSFWGRCIHEGKKEEANRASHLESMYFQSLLHTGGWQVRLHIAFGVSSIHIQPLTLTWIKTRLCKHARVGLLKPSPHLWKPIFSLWSCISNNCIYDFENVHHLDIGSLCWFWVIYQQNFQLSIRLHITTE